MKRLLAVGLLAVAFNAFAGDPPAAGDKPAAEKSTKKKAKKGEKTEKTEKETKDEGMKK